MLHGAHHMLLDSADRNAQLLGHFARSPPFKAPQDEYSPGPKRQSQQGFDRAAKIFLCSQDAMRIYILVAMAVGIELHMGLGPAGKAATRTVGQNIGGDREHVPAKMADRLFTVASYNPSKYFLDEVVRLVRVRHSVSEIAGKAVSQRPSLNS
ncbi:hypothetical protein ABID41_003702 [Phenylobacterium koreense]|uniref:Uncharacterized protein n=1 Tax=Phenylobacterium koreense TaxID=266125 RepID=A0ABV2ENF3_9CAUL